MVFEDVNKAGGIVVDGKRQQLQAVACDTAYRVDKLTECLNKLVFDEKTKFVAVLGGAMAVAARDFLREQGVLQVNWAYAGGVVDPNYPLMFSTISLPDVQAPALWSWFSKQYPQVKKRASIATDDETGRWCQGVSRKWAEQNGIQTVHEEWYPRGQVADFGPLVARVLASQPDVIDTCAPPAPDTAAIIKAAREQGYKGHFVEVGQKFSQALVRGAGKENVVGFISWGMLDTDFPSQAVKEWAQRYEQRYGPPFDYTSVETANVAFTLVCGLREAKSADPKAVATALERAKCQNLFGDFTFGAKEIYGIGHQILQPIIFGRIGDDGLARPVLVVQPDEYMRPFRR
jgi:branched-chain amino acid transport system substrate-binding protein